MSGLGLGRVQIQMRPWTVVAWNDQFSASLFSNCPSSFCWWWSILVCAGLFYRMTFQSTKRATSFPYSPHFGSRPVVIRLGGPRISRWKLFFLRACVMSCFILLFPVPLWCRVPATILTGRQRNLMKWTFSRYCCCCVLIYSLIRRRFCFSTLS